MFFIKVVNVFGIKFVTEVLLLTNYRYIHISFYIHSSITVKMCLSNRVGETQQTNGSMLLRVHT